MKKNNLIKLICSFVCAVFVFSFCMNSVDFFASVSEFDSNDYYCSSSVTYELPTVVDDFNYYALFYWDSNSKFVLFLSDDVSNLYLYTSNDGKFLNFGGSPKVRYVSNDGLNWSVSSSLSGVNLGSYYFVKSNFDILDETGSIFFKKDGLGDESFNVSIGYLQNVNRKSTYIRDELYNYDDDSLTYHWYHDLSSTGGVDLSSGDYKIRHYISNAKVKGYDKSDIVEMSEKYLMNEYDASKGYFSYLQKDYLEKLEALGYEEIGFIDKYLKGYFTLQHHYFQIVNTSTNEVGGYLHFYPKDASGENFGVEMVYEGLDLNDEIDPDGPNGFIDTDVGSGTTIEDALENADAPKLDDLGGIDPLIENLEGYANQITNVTNGIGALLGSLPPWIVGLLGLSFGLFFVLIAVKVLRG